MATDKPMQLGMVGLGRMGANIVRRLMRDGHTCVVYDVNPDAVQALAGEGPSGPLAGGFRRQADQAARGLGDGACRRYHRADDRRRRRPCSRQATSSSTAATPTTATTSAARAQLRTQGHPPRRLRHERRRLGPRARFLPHDRRRDDVVDRPPPDLRVDRARASAPPPARPGRDRRAEPAEQGFLHCGPNGAGPLREDGSQRHRVRNDGRLRRGPERASATPTSASASRRATPRRPRCEHPEYYQYDIDTTAVAEVWRRGSVIGSWLLDLTAEALLQSPDLEAFAGRVSDSGEGRWTSTAAIEEGVPTPVLTGALYSRFARASSTSSPTGPCRRCARSSAATTRRRADEQAHRRRDGRAWQ